jgi:hypothetical protein
MYFFAMSKYLLLHDYQISDYFTHMVAGAATSSDVTGPAATSTTATASPVAVTLRRQIIQVLRELEDPRP